MHVLIGIALKSLLIAGLTLGMLELMKKRSAAERSWVAHIGLLALLIMAFAPVVLPSWNVEAPSFLAQAAEPAVNQAIAPAAAATASTVPATHAVAKMPVVLPSLSAAAAVTAAYALPAAILLFITLLALARLIALRARAEVLVDGHWLSALAHAQQRMGFKHGTALLTSDELASPISWGLMRPVILLNSRAVKATGEAEAIIAHELAHVARMDWVKLLLARIVTGLFWFNPLVWLLAREAHQLREEAADDAVLAADIDDTDYAQLLVGVARHECPGLLLGAHGVAPSKNSLARRVARVLDSTSVRGPAARHFALGVFTGAVLVTAPLTAVTLTPAGTAKPIATDYARPAPHRSIDAADREVPSDLPHIIAAGVSTSVTAAMAAVDSDRAEVAQARAEAARAEREVAKAAKAHQEISAHDDAISRAIAIKTVGATPEYVAAMRAAAPELNLDQEDVVQLKAVGVTPVFIQELARLGYRDLRVDQITGAYSVGVRSDYVRALASAGYGRLSLNQLLQLKAVGVTPADVERLRRAGYAHIDVDKLVQLKTLGITPEELKASERYGP